MTTKSKNAVILVHGVGGKQKGEMLWSQNKNKNPWLDVNLKEEPSNEILKGLNPQEQKSIGKVKKDADGNLFTEYIWHDSSNTYENTDKKKTDPLKLPVAFIGFFAEFTRIGEVLLKTEPERSRTLCEKATQWMLRLFRHLVIGLSIPHFLLILLNTFFYMPVRAIAAYLPPILWNESFSPNLDSEPSIVLSGIVLLISSLCYIYLGRKKYLPLQEHFNIENPEKGDKAQKKMLLYNENYKAGNPRVIKYLYYSIIPMYWLLYAFQLQINLSATNRNDLHFLDQWADLLWTAGLITISPSMIVALIIAIISLFNWLFFPLFKKNKEKKNIWGRVFLTIALSSMFLGFFMNFFFAVYSYFFVIFFELFGMNIHSSAFFGEILTIALIPLMLMLGLMVLIIAAYSGLYRIKGENKEKKNTLFNKFLIHLSFVFLAFCIFAFFALFKQYNIIGSLQNLYHNQWSIFAFLLSLFLLLIPTCLFILKDFQEFKGKTIYGPLIKIGILRAAYFTSFLWLVGHTLTFYLMLHYQGDIRKLADSLKENIVSLSIQENPAIKEKYIKKLNKNELPKALKENLQKNEILSSPSAKFCIHMEKESQRWTLTEFKDELDHKEKENKSWANIKIKREQKFVIEIRDKNLNINRTGGYNSIFRLENIQNNYFYSILFFIPFLIIFWIVKDAFWIVIEFARDVYWYLTNKSSRDQKMIFSWKCVSHLASLIKCLKAKGYTKVILVAHSQGSIVCYDLLRYSELFFADKKQKSFPKIHLITFGTPITSLYSSLLASHMYSSPIEILPKVQSWTNFYCVNDYIGTRVLEENSKEKTPEKLKEIELPEKGGHTNYWGHKKIHDKIISLLKIETTPE